MLVSEPEFKFLKANSQTDPEFIQIQIQILPEFKFRIRPR